MYQLLCSWKTTIAPLFLRFHTPMGLSRQEVASHLYSIWTSSGSDLSGLAPLYFNGVLDVLALYQVECEPVSLHDADASCDSNTTCDIAMEDCNSLSYTEFVDRYMRPNVPVVLCNLTASWPSPELRTLRPNMDYIRACFGGSSAPVHVTTITQTPFGGSSRPKRTDMAVAEYCDWWDTKDPSDPDVLYLKDWKFPLAFPDHPIYEVPEYFKEDWLNDLLKSYRFVYLGPRGTTTRLHADVLFSYSWSTNLSGTKRWHLCPPSKTHLLRDIFNQRLAPHMHVDLESSLPAYPGLSVARGYTYTVIQKAGETIFVPSGWHHTVENLEDTMSVNHNWINGYNLKWSWDRVSAELAALSVGDEERETSSAEIESTPNPYDSQETLQVQGDLVLLYDIIADRIDNHFSALTFADLTTIVGVLTNLVDVVEGKGDNFGVKDRTNWRGNEHLTKARGALLDLEDEKKN